jgi:hypothetical protein
MNADPISRFKVKEKKLKGLEAATKDAKAVNETLKKYLYINEKARKIKWKAYYTMYGIF